ncbi:probable glutathione S-transferase parA [Selaginella moellendorffii]|uniref:probable glutathione S-transferase parA n=1 Tax=Selaginella moellendorffii TaxID=88036 RepID=UPI000D1CD161|nr:probable glutathione S-transferase parA [Selaginella moellendorffii]|eukprot:XP_024542881.1 probable glutathione S-transferase parA [Selaginella moellendorffii]
MLKDSVKLLNFWPSTFGLRVHYALDLKGVFYNYQEESLPNKSKELLEANPIYMKIPVLIHNSKPICESLITLTVCGLVLTSSPEDPYEKTVARFWADFGDKKHKKANEDFKWALMKINEALDTIAPGKPFFGGDTMNFADVALAPFICWFKGYQKELEDAANAGAGSMSYEQSGIGHEMREIPYEVLKKARSSFSDFELADPADADDGHLLQQASQGSGGPAESMVASMENWSSAGTSRAAKCRSSDGNLVIFFDTASAEALDDAVAEFFFAEDISFNTI